MNPWEYTLGSKRPPGRPNPREFRSRNGSSPDELERRYDAVYNYNRGNWDNPNSASSMNNPVWEPDDEWGWPGPYVGFGPRRSRADDAICENVCKRMTANGRLDASDIEVTVQDHEVTLEGTVENRLSKRLAEAIAESVRGVDDVHNNLHLKK